MSDLPPQGGRSAHYQFTTIVLQSLALSVEQHMQATTRHLTGHDIGIAMVVHVLTKPKRWRRVLDLAPAER